MATPTRTRSRRHRLAAVVTVGLLVLTACGDADVGTPEDRDRLGEHIDEYVSEREPPAGASERVVAWTALANEYVAEELAAEDDEDGSDGMVERIVLAGVDLLPPGMPVPDLGYLGSIGVSPTTPGCVASFQIDVGMYELNAEGRPVSYSFSYATSLMEGGFATAGWDMLDMVDLYPDGHPVDPNGKGTQYLVDVDGEHWRVWIITYLSAAHAQYCPAS